jgi:hypothetical protein
VPARKSTDRRSLSQVAEAFGLDAAGLAVMLRVSVAELERWERAGVPAARQRELDDIVFVAETLDRKLKPGTVAQVVRRPAAAYGGQSLLDLLTVGHHEQARRAVAGSFDWALSA